MRIHNSDTRRLYRLISLLLLFSLPAFLLFFYSLPHPPSHSDHQKFSSDQVFDLLRGSHFPIEHCIHDRIASKILLKQVHSSHPPLQEATLAFSKYRLSDPRIKKDNFKPIRIHADYSNLGRFAATHPNKIAFIKNHLVPTAFSFFEKTLSVYPNPSRIIVPYADVCYDAVIPEEHMTKGLENTDLLIYVTATNEPRETYGAYAVACVQDKRLHNRPIIGQITYNLAYLPIEKKNRWDRLSTTLHEITHVLGFSSYMFQFFIDENGKQIGKDKVVQRLPRRNLTDTLVLILPKVTEVAREYYGCNEVVGQELENRGDLGSRGSHWEQIVLKNEMMTAISTPDRVYSRFTLAVLEGSGWYKVNYENAQQIYWGRGKGCEFLDQGCDGGFEEFCYDDLEQGCTFDGIGLAECGAGGPFFDMCLSYNKYSNGDCRLSHNMLQNESGEVFTSRSRCVKSDFRVSGGKAKHGVRCYETECVKEGNETVLVFILNDRSRVKCREDGEVIHAPEGWEGKLRCPRIEGYCAKATPSECPFGCWGKGVCTDGECMCGEGFNGDDCAQGETPGFSSGNSNDSRDDDDSISTSDPEGRASNSSSGSPSASPAPGSTQSHEHNSTRQKSGKVDSTSAQDGGHALRSNSRD